MIKEDSALEELVERITDSNESAFDLSDTIEELFSRNHVHSLEITKSVLRAFATRYETDSSFRNDMDDLDILRTILDHNQDTDFELFELLITHVCGSHRGLRTVLRECGVLKELHAQLKTALKLPHSHSKTYPLCSLAHMACRGITDNKKIFFDLLEELLNHTTQTEAIQLLVTLITDDDKERRSDPSIVMMRKTIIDGENFTIVRNLIKELMIAPSSTADRELCVTLMSELSSTSQMNARLIAIEDGGLHWVCGNHASLNSPNRLLRTWSLCDDLKEHIFDRIDDWFTIPIDHHMFAILANLSLRNPTRAFEICQRKTEIVDIIERCIKMDTTGKRRTQCLQFVRTLVRMEQGRELFQSCIESLKEKDDKNDERFVADIFNQINRGIQKIGS